MMTHHGLDAYLCCLVGADQYAVRGADVRLVARAEQLTPQTGGDGRVGVLPRAGGDVPVYSLPSLLGGARDTRTADRHIVVIGSGDALALLVDRVVRAPAGSARELPLPTAAGRQAARWFSGLLTLSETSCLVLNPSGLRPGAWSAPPGAGPLRRAHGRAPAAVEDLAFVFTSEAVPTCDGARQAVPASRLAAIVQSLPLVAVPGVAAHVAAFAAWRDAAVPVVDYSRGFVATQTARRFAVLVAGDAALIAVPVDADAELRRAAPQDRRAGGTVLPAHVKGMFDTGGGRVALLDLERVASGACTAAPFASASTQAGVPALV